MSDARLITTYAARRPQAVVLALHGGAARAGRPMVSPVQLSVLRMVPIARRIAREGRGRVAVLRLLNSHRGWDSTRTPVHDVEWAIDRARERYGDLPVGLVGHSLGGRAALLAGGEDGVRSVVALNPWVYPTDRVDLRGRAVLIVHGSDDRVADIGRARVVAAALAETADVRMVTVPGGKHAMLRGAGAFERAASEFTLTALLSAWTPPR